jgi:hypothetical protein
MKIVKYILFVCTFTFLFSNILSLNLKAKEDFDDPLKIDNTKYLESSPSSDDSDAGFLQLGENKTKRIIEVKNDGSDDELAFAQTNIHELLNQPGYIDPWMGIRKSSLKNRRGYRNQAIKRKNSMRFTQKQDEDYFNPNPQNSDANIPGKELEMIRHEGLSNGVVLSKNKRTANFETGEFPDMFYDLKKD